MNKLAQLSVALVAGICFLSPAATAQECASKPVVITQIVMTPDGPRITAEGSGFCNPVEALISSLSTVVAYATAYHQLARNIVAHESRVVTTERVESPCPLDTAPIECRFALGDQTFQTSQQAMAEAPAK